MLKNITLSAEEELLQKAKKKAQRERTTLNATFRQWLKQYVASDSSETDYETLMNALSYAQVGGKFTREELNER